MNIDTRDIYSNNIRILEDIDDIGVSLDMEVWMRWDDEEVKVGDDLHLMKGFCFDSVLKKLLRVAVQMMQSRSVQKAPPAKSKVR